MCVWACRRLRYLRAKLADTAKHRDLVKLLSRQALAWQMTVGPA